MKTIQVPGEPITLLQFTPEELKEHNERIRAEVYEQAAQATLNKLADTIGSLPIEAALDELHKYAVYLHKNYINKDRPSAKK